MRPLAEDEPVPYRDGDRCVTTLPGSPWQHTTQVVVPAAEEKR
jgi:hypothetical protein